MRVSALSPVSLAIVAALKGDASLTALIGGRVYQGRGPVAAVAPYLVLNTPAENADNTFGRGGTINAEQIHVYAATDQMVRVLSGHIMRVLANDPLYIGGGFDIVSRDINLVTIVRDPDLPLSHGVLRFLPRLSQWPDWPGVWEPTSATVLFAEAFGQDQGSQIVRSRIGPNGWLGTVATVDNDDPSYASSPTRWHMDGIGATGYRPTINFGDVLDDVFNDPAGFTVAAIVDLRDTLIPDTFTTIINKDRDYQDTLSNGVWFCCVQDFLQLTVAHNGLSADKDTITTPVAGLITPGPQVLGGHYDPTQTRGARGGLWRNGATLSHIEQLTGNDGPVETSPTHLQFAGNHGSGVRSPESAGAIVITRGVMDADWHAGFYAHAQARGWL